MALGCEGSRGCPLPPTRRSPRAHKAPGADVRAPLGAAGPQCGRSRARSHPCQAGAAASAPSPRSQPGARPAHVPARPANLCHRPCPAPRSPSARIHAPPAGHQSWVSECTGLAPPPQPRPHGPAPPPREGRAATPLRWRCLCHLRHAVDSGAWGPGGVRLEMRGRGGPRCPERPGARLCSSWGRPRSSCNRAALLGVRCVGAEKLGAGGCRVQRAHSASRAAGSCLISSGWERVASCWFHGTSPCRWRLQLRVQSWPALPLFCSL